MPMNRVQFQEGMSPRVFLRRYGTEQDCERELEAQRLPQGFQCPNCGACQCSNFRRGRLPLRLRSDNGVPFAAYSLGRLSRLSVWLRKLGITPELIEPGKPQQNGRHERMHRTLKDETLKPPAANATAQQRKFNGWRREFNEDRPHGAHDGLTPSDVHVDSPRQMPSKLLAPEYPDRFEVRYVSANGGIRWRKKWINISSVLIGEHVGLEEVDDGQWDVYFANFRLGRLNERFMRIEDSLGRLKRHV